MQAPLHPSVQVAAAIIAGGQAKRLGGIPKGNIVIDGQRIIDRQLAVLRPLFGHVFLVAADARSWCVPDLEIVSDRVPGAGPLAGLDAALGALRAAERAVVCVAGDMPFIDTAALALLRDHRPEAAALIPLVAGRPEPLFARYGQSCIHAVRAALAQGRFKAADLVRELDPEWIDEATLRSIDPELRFLTNVNTQEDLARYA